MEAFSALAAMLTSVWCWLAPNLLGKSCSGYSKSRLSLAWALRVKISLRVSFDSWRSSLDKSWSKLLLISLLHRGYLTFFLLRTMLPLPYRLRPPFPASSLFCSSLTTSLLSLRTLILFFLFSLVYLLSRPLKFMLFCWIFWMMGMGICSLYGLNTWIGEVWCYWEMVYVIYGLVTLLFGSNFTERRGVSSPGKCMF